MEKNPAWLLDFKSDIYSLMGEDGVIEKILKTIPNKDRWCVEFGAWDGKYASNTRNLIENQKYLAVLIEASKEKFKDLQKNYLNNPQIITINQLVGFDKKDNLDQILKKTPVPSDFDFLSIDIDGNDYHVWKSMVGYKPKAVCIEFNPTIPTEIEFVQPADLTINQGASLLSLTKLGKEKGYELVSVLAVNAFFARKEYFPLFKIKNNSPVALRKNLDNLTYLFVGYDGKVFLRGFKELLWHGIPLDQSTIQPLPGFLQKFPPNYNRIEKVLAAAFLLFSFPQVFFKKLAIRLKKFF